MKLDIEFKSEATIGFEALYYVNVPTFYPADV